MTGGGPSQGRREPKNLICDAAAGASAGAIAATFVCPLDVIKTRLQVHGLPVTSTSTSTFKGSIIITSLQDIVKKEGFRGLYHGLSPTILALLPTWAVYFPVYEHLKGLLQKDEQGTSQLTIGKNMIAAAGAGAATAVTTNPLWVVKTRLQTQGMREDVIPYKGISSALRRITCDEGISGLYSGLLPSLAGISHVAIQFPAYERLKFYLAKRENTTVDKLNPGSLTIASSISKIVASMLTYPHEVVRSRLQEQGQVRNNGVRYAGVVDCVRKVFQAEGLPGFYRGCATNLLRTVPNSVITFTSYEMILRFLKRVENPTTKSPFSQSNVDGPGKPHCNTKSGEENGSGSEQITDHPARAPSIPVSKDQMTVR